MNQTFKKILSFILIASMLGGCSSFGNRKLSSEAGIASQDAEEIAIGRQIHESIIARMPVYQNETVNAYIRTLGQSLIPYVRRKNLPYHFSVLSDDRIFATSAPGGYVYITTGFVRFVDNEAELAAVLAHEMGELQRRDPKLSQAIKLLEKTIAASSVVAPVFGSIGALAMLGLVGVHSMVSNEPNKTSRLEEADELALEFLWKAGHDPQGLIDVYYKIIEASPQDLMYLFDYQQSRTVTMTRLLHAESLFSKMEVGQKAFDARRDQFLLMTQTLREQVPQVST